MIIRNSVGCLIICLTACAVQAQPLSVQLVPSDHNGFAISCFGGRDGSVTAIPAGGTPPYTYQWMNQATTATLTDLAAGYYRVTITDADTNRVQADITLDQPPSLRAQLIPFEYPNGFNISCNECYNGSISVNCSGGVPPYLYEWRDGAIGQTRSALGSNTFAVNVTDANGCEYHSEALFLTQPTRNGWNMDGNNSTDPSQHFIGTADTASLVFKTDSDERLRINGNGAVSIKDLQFSSGYQIVMADSAGTLRLLTGPLVHNYVDPWKGPGCPNGAGWPWLMCGNHVWPNQFLGSTNEMPLIFKTSNETRMMITASGKVGIGTGPPGGAIDEYRLFVEDGIVTREVLVQTGPWPDYVFEPQYDLLSFDDLRSFIHLNKHLPGIPSAADIETADGVALGDMQPRLLKVVEEQALYILQLEEKFRLLEERMKRLEEVNK